METLKIDCMAETVNGQPYEKHEYVIKKEADASVQGSFSNLGSSLVWVPDNGNSWVIDRADTDAISSSVIADYIVFTNNFDGMVKDILGKDEIIFHSQEYIDSLPNKIVRQFCKELCRILLDEYEKGPAASWDSGSNHIITAIGSSSGHTIKGLRVYDPWHTIARMYDIGVITAKDLGISEEEFNEHISWYKIKKKK